MSQRSIDKPRMPRLTNEESQELALYYDQLEKSCLYNCRRFGLEYDVAKSLAVQGAIRAIRNYKPNMGMTKESYVNYYVRQELAKEAPRYKKVVNPRQESESVDNMKENVGYEPHDRSFNGDYDRDFHEMVSALPSDERTLIGLLLDMDYNCKKKPLSIMRITALMGVTKAEARILLDNIKKMLNKSVYE